MKLQLLLCLVYALAVLAVNRPPLITLQPTERDIYYKPGESVKILCDAEGTPNPQFLWRRNGEEYNPSGQDSRVVQLPDQGTIVFNSPEDKDEGIFQCFADNGYGVSASVKINFREAKLKKFPYEEPVTHIVEAGEPLTLPCTPPQSYPPADVYWVYKEPDGRWQAINFDKRVSMDIEGRLRFTNVKKSDHINGKAYSCMAINYFMRDNAIGPEHLVEVRGSTEQKRPAEELWTSPSGQFFVKGKLLKLKCIFSGNPTPDVYWNKIDGVLPERAAFKSFGQELHIKDVQLSDAGQYECMGLNTESTQRATKAFDVRIESAPEWVHMPENAERGVGEKATFICRATGDPKVEYSWYINGVPLEDRQNEEGVRDPRIYRNKRFLKPNENNITLTDLTLDDHMNIQCNASNKHGYVFADVYLNVLQAAPTIIVPPPATMTVAEGKSVILTCVVTGKPDPIIEWYRDTSLITGGRFKIMPTGSLRIENVVMADAGDYRCQATNRYAANVTSSACKMQIRRKTRIEQFPMDLEVIAGYDAKFTCSGSTDFDEAKNMQVFWEKDDKLVSTSEQRMTQNFQDNSLTISGTIVRDSGVYTCIITNGLDEDRAYAILTVKDRPDPPSGVAVERCRDDSVDLKWIKGIENNAPVQYFVIQYNTSFSPDQWVSAATVDYTQNTASIALGPWANYTFRVVATNKIGASAPSFHTTTRCYINPSQPYKNPSNVRAIGDRPGYLRIEWTPMNELEHNGPGFKYQLSVRERGTPKPDVINIADWRNTSIDLRQPKIYTPFLVKVQAKNNKGDAMMDPIEYTLFSSENIPKVSPVDVQITDISDTTARLSWRWDEIWSREEGEIKFVQGKMTGFRIQFYNQNEKYRTFREVHVPLADAMPKDPPAPGQQVTSFYELTNLSPHSNIRIRVCVTNNYYVGSPSDELLFTTFKGVPGPVQDFEVFMKSSNSFLLRWNQPLPEDNNGILTGYDIGFQTVHGLELGAFHDRDEQINDPFQKEVALSGLLPNTKYRVHIYARTEYGRGEGVFVEATTTPEVYIEKPMFKIRDVTESQMNVTWSLGAYYGMHVVYYVEFRKEGAADWQQSTDETLRNWKLIVGLEKGTYYEVRVVAYDGFRRVRSDSQVEGTDGFAAARAVAANYGWFIGMLLSGLVFIGVVVFIYWIHRKRKDIEEAPKTRPVSGAAKYDEDYGRQPRGEYDDYYKDDRYDYKNEGYDGQSAGSTGYSNRDYDPKSYGPRDDKYQNQGYDREEDYHRDYDYDRDYSDRDDYDDDYDRDSLADEYEDPARRRYQNTPDTDYVKEKPRYDDDDDDVRRRGDSYADPPPRYQPQLSRELKNRYSVDGEGEYTTEPSKFDDEGYPVEKPADPHSSTFV